ncbi:hypothetical protein J4446_01200 [Candidatus Woesearchaeota archaeon]|nr:hypothetical protein [Candidatus Woesearchaeota archaeon]
MDNNMETIDLGDSIKLIDFKNIDRDKFIVVKKIVGNFVKKLQDSNSGFENLSLHLKTVHNNEYEIIGRLSMKGSQYSSGVINYNLFYAINEVLKKLESELH